MFVRRVVLAVTAVAAVAGSVAVTAPAQAYAGTPGCVTTTEFRSVRAGMSQRQVAEHFGTSARPYWGVKANSFFDDDGFSAITRSFRVCDRAGDPRLRTKAEAFVHFQTQWVPLDIDGEDYSHWGRTMKLDEKYRVF